MTKKVKTELGRLLTELRTIAGQTLVQQAYAIGASKTRLSAWQYEEIGEDKIKEIVKKLANYYDDFFTGDGCVFDLVEYELYSHSFLYLAGLCVPGKAEYGHKHLVTSEPVSEADKQQDEKIKEAIKQVREPKKAKSPIDVIIDRFLSYKFPDDFNPDGGISYSEPLPKYEDYYLTGTNLFNYDQAKDMFRSLLSGFNIDFISSLKGFEIGDITNLISDKDADIARKNKVLSQLNSDHDALKREHEALQIRFECNQAAFDKHVEEMQEWIETLKSELSENDAEIQALKADISEKAAANKYLREELVLTRDVNDKEIYVIEKNMKSKDTEIKQASYLIKKLQENAKLDDEQIRELQDSNGKLVAENGSLLQTIDTLNHQLSTEKLINASLEIERDKKRNLKKFRPLTWPF